MAYKDLTTNQKRVYAAWADIFRSVAYDFARALGKAGAIETDFKPMSDAEVAALRTDVDKALALDTATIDAILAR